MEKDRISQLPDPVICQILDHLSTKQFFPVKALLQGEDRISQLPDHLICQILGHLSTKQSVKTSVLSTRWRNLWLCLPCLELYSQNFPDFDAFVSFGHRVFESNRVACLQKLKLTIEDEDDIVEDVSYLTAWIDTAAKHKIQHLEFSWFGNLQVHTNHLRLYKCETLVYLKLCRVTFDYAEFVSFPCLKTMHLVHVLYPNKAAFEKLISRCLVLEELNIYFIEDDKKGFQVHSQSLKRLTLVQELLDFEAEAVPGIVIDAPLLCFLSIRDYITESVIVSNWESNAKLSISLLFGFGDFDESKISNICSFLSGISRVGDMKICPDTFKCIIQYSKVKPLPQFGFMSCLEANLCASDLKCLPTFLESCPSLKSLILNWKPDYEEMSQMSFSSVPKCLQSSLEFITVSVPFKACAAEMKIVKYFLENSPILKKLTLRLEKRNSWTEKYIREDLHKIPRGSTKCEVHVTVSPY